MNVKRQIPHGYKHQHRTDLGVIADLIVPESSVLDLGCGDGSFLRRLKEENDARVMGLEISQEQVAQCIGNGVPVIQGNLDDRLDFAEDKSFDYVIVSRTLQEVRKPDLLLSEIVRVGKRAIVSVINFGYYHYRFELFFGGRMPRSRHLPHEWFNTPNIHLGTILDFRDLCRKKNIKILREIPIGHHRLMPDGFWPNLMAYSCVFELTQNTRT